MCCCSLEGSSTVEDVVAAAPRETVGDPTFYLGEDNASGARPSNSTPDVTDAAGGLTFLGEDGRSRERTEGEAVESTAGVVYLGEDDNSVTKKQVPVEEPTAAFCSRDAAFRLCMDCAEPYRRSPDTEVADALLNCPGHHGLSNVLTHGSARCDQCKEILAADDVLRACRSCNWGVCPTCLAQSPQGARAPRFDIGACCRAEWRGKPVRAVVVDSRGEADDAEVLLHYPGQSAEASDEWVEVTSHKIIPVDPPPVSLHFHPAHPAGLVAAPMPNFPDRGPKCTAEIKFPGGCRRYVAEALAEPPPDNPTGLYCERTNFFLCPWCVESDIVDSARNSAAVKAAHRADVEALRNPSRRSDAATRIAQQCSRSVAALVGFIEAGVVKAVSEALSVSTNDGGASEALPRPLLSLFLGFSEWLFNEPSPPSVGDRVLCKRADETYHLASVTEVHEDPKTYSVKWADGGDDCAALQAADVRKLQSIQLAPSTPPPPPVPSRQTVFRLNVPPPVILTRDYLMKRAIPADNPAQARQYLIDGADLEVKNEAGDGALVLALYHCCGAKMVRLLLEFGCPIAAGATLGEPLQLAARYGQIENMELLLDARADPQTLCCDDLSERTRWRIAPLAALLSIGDGGEATAKLASVNLASERTVLALEALPPLARFLARPPDGFEESELSTDIEARLLTSLDSLLGERGRTCSTARGSGTGEDTEDPSRGIVERITWTCAHADCSEQHCTVFNDLTELAQRLMSMYSVPMSRHALLLIRRLLATGPHAHAELTRCGVHRFVARLAASESGEQRFRDTGLRGEGVLELTTLASEVEAVLGSPSGETESALCNVAAAIGDLARSAFKEDSESIRKARELLSRLGELLLPSSTQSGASAFELEMLEVPQGLLALLESGSIGRLDLAEALGNDGMTALTVALLRLIETTEVLPVQPLPTHLSQAPGLRVLCEPINLVLLGTQEEDMVPFRKPEVEKYWMQIEPLLRMKELERLVLLTTPVIRHEFLEWCFNLVGCDVAPSDANRSVAAATGRVVGFRLATPLRVGVHTVRWLSDGRESDLIASLHGLAAVGSTPASPPGLDLRVALTRLEAALPPADFDSAFSAIREATQKRQGIRVVTDPAARSESADSQVWLGTLVVPPVAKETLGVLGFTRHSVEEDVWVCLGACSLGAVLEEIAEARTTSRGTRAGGATFVDPDLALVSELASIFSENGAKRACSAVNNASAEAAMEWACQHQGDVDFNDPLPDSGRCSADARAPVWSVFIMLPEGVPFDLVWPMLEDPVKGALTSVANAWTAMGWAGGEAEMRETLRTQVSANGEGTIARGLRRPQADRVASRLRNACECRVEPDPEGAANAPRGNGTASSGTLALGTRVQVVLEADQLGIAANVSETGDVDVITDDGRLLSSLSADQVRVVAPRAQSTTERPRPPLTGLERLQQTVLQGVLHETNQAKATVSMAELLGSPLLALLQCTFEALDRGAQESDVVRRFTPQDLLQSDDADGKGDSQGGRNLIQHPAPICRVAFSFESLPTSGIDLGALYLLRGERAFEKSTDPRSFSSKSWISVGCPGLTVSSGSWYFEVELKKLKNPQIGWADSAFRFLVGAYCDDGVGDDANSWAVDGERCCLWHKGKVGEWREAATGQVLGCAVSIENARAKMWFGVNGVWDEKPVFDLLFDQYLYPAVSGELHAHFRFSAEEVSFGPPDPSFRPLMESASNGQSAPSTYSLLPPTWTALQGLYRLAKNGLPDTPVPLVVRAKIMSERGGAAAQLERQLTETGLEDGCSAVTSQDAVEASPLLLRQSALDEGRPLRLENQEVDRVLEVCGISSTAARAALRLLQELQGVPAVAGLVAQQVACTDISGSTKASTSRGLVRHGGRRRLGTKIQSHLVHSLACCSGAFPRWCRELPILMPWLFPLEAREALLRCSAFGVTFAVRWLQELAVDERFAERRRNAEERLAQAKQIGDAAELNKAYESLLELQDQIAKDTEAWVGSLKSELAKMEREKVLQQAERAMELTRASPCALEVQFEGESGFGRAVTQGFYTLIAEELQRRSSNRQVPMWIEDDPPLTEDFLRLRNGLCVRPLPPDDPRLPEVTRRFCMLGRLMAKALREGFVIPLPLTLTFYKMLLGGSIDPVSGLPRPGDGVAGEFLGACAAFVADGARAPGRLAELATDPSWSQKYMQPPDEPVAAVPFEAYASSATFLENGMSGTPLCVGGEERRLDVDSAPEFVRLAADFWLKSGVEQQMNAFRRGLYDVLGSGAVSLWAFSPAELRRLFGGEDEVHWSEKDLAEHLRYGGGYTTDTQQVKWLRDELLVMEQPLRAKFLDFVSSCPRLPPGGLRELQLSIHPDTNAAGLPRSRACAHRLFLPRYASREELALQLHEAILSSGGHHEQQLPP